MHTALDLLDRFGLYAPYACGGAGVLGLLLAAVFLRLAERGHDSRKDGSQ